MSLIKQFELNEGRRRHAYLDSLKIWTTGIGFNLERHGANEALRAQGVNPDLIWAAIEETKRQGNGRKPGDHTVDLLSDAQVDALFTADIADVVSDLKVLFKDFNALPEAAQDVLADMRFQLGAAGLRGFKDTMAAFREKRWKDAAKGMRGSKAYKQTPVRWERNAKTIESLA